jgi:glycosyltransferase involved in cell wall biosynthesis
MDGEAAAPEALQSPRSDRPTLNDVLGGAFEAHARGDWQRVIDQIDSFAGIRADDRPPMSRVAAAETGAERFSRATSIAAWLIGQDLNLGYVTQLFFLLANAVGEFPESAEIDDTAVTAEIYRRYDGRTAWDRAQIALFAAVALRRAEISEEFIRKLLNDPNVSLETRLALASGVSIIYQTMRKANLPLGYEGISRGLADAYFRPNRQRFGFVAEIVDRVGSEFAAELLKHGFVRRRPQHSPRLKICLLVEEFGHKPLNTTTKLIIDYAYLLVSRMGNITVDIVVAKNHWPNGEFRMVGVHSGADASLEALLEAYGFATTALKEQRLTLTYLDAPTQGGYTERFIAALAGLNPDCIVLFPVPHFVLEQALYSNFPVIAVELVNGMLSSPLIDVLIPNGKPTRATVERYGDKLVLMPLPDVPFVARENYTRETLGYPASAAGVVIATVALNFERRMRVHPGHEAYWDHVATVLRTHPEVVWQLVGINTEGEASILAECAELRQFVDNGQLRFKQYEADLSAFLQCCDIYAHPPITGGGRGVALAAPCALPILCYVFNDAANLLPEDQLYGTHEDYFLALDRLIEDPEFRRTLGASNSRILGDDYFSYCAQGLFYAALKAIERYNERQGLQMVSRD